MYVRPRRGRALIVGSRVYENRPARKHLHPDSVGVDMLPGPGVDVVCDMEEPQDLGQFAHVECISVLEHSKRPWALADNLQNLMEPAATIYLTVPFIWRPHAYPNDYWRFTTEAVRLLFPRIVWYHLTYAHEYLQRDGKLPAVKRNDHLYMARTEVYGFGAKE
jgi:hypothetical protein